MPNVVLLPLDRSVDARAAIPVGAEVARVWGIGVRLLTVVVPNSDQDAAADHLREAAASAGLAGYDVTVVASGAPGEEILRTARADDAVVCMTTHGRGRLGELVLGSLSQLVVARSTEPVVLVGPAAHTEPGAAPLGGTNPGPLLVPLDGSPTAERAVAAAVPWAERLGVGLHLVQAADAGAGPGDGSGEAALVTQARSLVGSAGLSITAAIVAGAPHDVVAAAAADRRSPMIVLTSRGATAEKDRSLSATARRIVRTAPVPVLVLPHHANPVAQELVDNEGSQG